MNFGSPFGFPPLFGGRFWREGAWLTEHTLGGGLHLVLLPLDGVSGSRDSASCSQCKTAERQTLCRTGPAEHPGYTGVSARCRCRVSTWPHVLSPGSPQRGTPARSCITSMRPGLWQSFQEAASLASHMGKGPPKVTSS